VTNRAATFTDEPTLTVAEVAALLGVTSPATIHNWLSQGYFPGVTRLADGTRRFRPSGVRAVQESIAAIEAWNANPDDDGFTDLGDEDPYAKRHAQQAEIAATRELGLPVD
jgi:predicted DNA-binding transcriptional regulator AlpA